MNKFLLILPNLIFSYSISGMSSEFINKTDELGRTPLLDAAEHNQTDMVEFLIKKDADINAQCKSGWSALMCASRNNNLQLINLLLDYKCDIELKNTSGHTAEFYANNKQIKQILEIAAEKLKFIKSIKSKSKSNLFKNLKLREIHASIFLKF